MRRSEDAYVDELFLPCVALGAPLLRALFPRAYLDVNREPYELDPQVFEGRLPDFANTRSLRVAVGLGTIPRVVGDAQPIYKQPLAVEEDSVESNGYIDPTIGNCGRWSTGHAPDRIRRLIDCHSMPSNAADVSGLDIVLGDRYERALHPTSLKLWKRAYARQGTESDATSPLPAVSLPSILVAQRKACTLFRSR